MGELENLNLGCLVPASMPLNHDFIFPLLFFFQHFIVDIFKHAEKLNKFTINTQIFTTYIIQLIFYYICLITYLYSLLYLSSNLS